MSLIIKSKIKLSLKKILFKNLHEGVVFLVIFIPSIFFLNFCFAENGNIKSKSASLGGTLKGNVNADNISIKKTANIEGVLNQKTLSVQEGARLKIKTETHK